jgi:hypothetical protein
MSCWMAGRARRLCPDQPSICIALAPGETVPGDRLYAIENGPSGFDPSAPAYLSKQHFDRQIDRLMPTPLDLVM